MTLTVPCIHKPSECDNRVCRARGVCGVIESAERRRASARQPEAVEQADPLDRRQRLAAAILLAAFDLPLEISLVSQLWLDAAKACPGVSVDEMQPGAGRRAGLERARALIDEMLAEARPA